MPFTPALWMLGIADFACKFHGFRYRFIRTQKAKQNTLQFAQYFWFCCAQRCFFVSWTMIFCTLGRQFWCIWIALSRSKSRENNDILWISFGHHANARMADETSDQVGAAKNTIIACHQLEAARKWKSLAIQWRARENVCACVSVSGCSYKIQLSRIVCLFSWKHCKRHVQLSCFTKSWNWPTTEHNLLNSS